jgi:hypothetical protein
MTSQSPRIYIYKITFEEVPYYYYGVKKEKYFNQEYWGSPVTHKWVWDFYTPKKQILEIFSYTDEGWIEAQEVEKRLIKPFYQTDEWCLNESCGGVMSLKVKSQNGKKVAENHKKNGTGLYALTPEQKSEGGKKGGKIGGKTGGKISGKKSYELGIGIHGMTFEERSERSKKNGLEHKENKTGVCGRSKEKMSEDGRRGGSVSGKKTYELKLGIHGLTPEQKTENGKKGAEKVKELGVGIYALNVEQRKENGKVGGTKSALTNRKNNTGLFGLSKEQRAKTAKKVNSQRWKCTETGYVSNAGALTNYQRARGIDTSKRIRIE